MIKHKILDISKLTQRGGITDHNNKNNLDSLLYQNCIKFYQIETQQHP